MDEKTDNLLRSLAAQSEANSLVINFLLTQLFLEIGTPMRENLAQLMRDAAERTEQFVGVARDEFHAERIADVVVLTQEAARRMIDRSLEAATKAQDLKR